MLEKSVNLLVRSVQLIRYSVIGLRLRCINIGCGLDVRPFWLNCDLEPKIESVKKLDITDPGDLAWLGQQNADLIVSDHVIGYLTIAQCDRFFESCYQCLSDNGRIILEFPDLAKILNKINRLDYSADKIDFDYIEIVRAIFAYDQQDAVSLKFDKQTYITAWTAEYVVRRLLKVGFKNIVVGEPHTHGQRVNRDTRIEATKS
jgi:predicted SAM-dependent methyltransferase